MIVESALIVDGLAWVFKRVGEHAVGATGHEFLRELGRVVLRKIGDPHERDRNQDIARAVRGAQLDALEAVLNGFAVVNAPRWDRAPDPTAQRFLADATVFCQRARDLLKDKDAELEFAPSVTLTASIEGLLADQLAFAAAGEQVAAVGWFAETAVLDELTAALTPLPVPSAFAAYLRDGEGTGHPRFLDLFGAGIAARLKDKESTRFRDILQTGWLADLKALGFETTEALARVEKQFGALGDSIKQDTSEIKQRLDELLRDKAATERDRVALMGEVERLRQARTMTDGAIAHLLVAVGETPSTPDQYTFQLGIAVARYRKLLEEAERPRNLPAQFESVRREAAGLIRNGLLDHAEARLAALCDHMAVWRREQRAMLDQAACDEAAVIADRAQIARTRLRYREAAGLFADAAAITPDNEIAMKWQHELARAASLYDQGNEFADNPALHEAIAAYRDALALVPRARVPLDWAATQMNLGFALTRVGERESGTVRLEQAVAAYRAALEEITRERAPLDWANTQMNLGTALRMLGERESGTVRLEQAVAAYRAALEEMARERVPLVWALTQMNFGSALLRLGEREGGTERLDQAVAAYRAALEEMTREQVPLDWAATQMNLGVALTRLGEREGGTERLDQAVAAYRAALEEMTRERVPLDWAATRMNLGIALTRLGERESGTARLEDAVAAFRAALEERTRQRVPLDWAATQMNLGTALRMLGEREGGTAHLEEAMAVWEACLTVAASFWPAELVEELHSARSETQAEIARRSGE